MAEAEAAVCTFLTKEQIKECDDRRTEELDLRPFWPGKVRVGILSGTDRDRFELALNKHQKSAQLNGRESLRATLAALACVDEDGKPLFTPDDILWLSDKSSRALDLIWQAAIRLNGLDNDAVDETAKNSPGGLSDDSGSSSAANTESSPTS